MEVTVIGAGLAGMYAALTLAGAGVSVSLVSLYPSERAQSVLAEGGINAALDTMGEGDTPGLHMEDTLSAGCHIADPDAVRALCEHAPEIVRHLESLGVPFNREGGQIALRSFGGQKRKRTVYAKSSSGKMIASALIDELRKHEASGLVQRFDHHEFVCLLRAEEKDESVCRATERDGFAAAGGVCVREPSADAKGRNMPGGGRRRACAGVRVADIRQGGQIDFYGPVILACGGLNGFFPGMTTGTTINSGEVAAEVFWQGVRMGNLEMIQFHPTTFRIAGKRCLISEAARGEGGRLYAERGGKKYYFMEDKYPELGNLMPRDVVSREMNFILEDPAYGGKVYLDMRGIEKKVWNERLSDLRYELMHYGQPDPAREPVLVEPGIHYFMGGIEVDASHRCSMEGLYAAGECCCQYHGANRLGGNSMLGALFGGRIAAQTLMEDCRGKKREEGARPHIYSDDAAASLGEAPSPHMIRELGKLLSGALGIVRCKEELCAAADRVRELKKTADLSPRERKCMIFAQAMLESAIIRRESRGAHYRSDYTETSKEYESQTVADFIDGAVIVEFRKQTGTGTADDR